MKRRKTILALALTAALTLTALTACGGKPEPEPEPTPEPVTAASLLGDMNARLREQGSFSADMQASLTFTVTAGRESPVTFPLDMALTMDAVCEPLQYHAAGSAGMTLLGMDVDLPMEFYAVEDGGALNTYVKVLDAWMHRSAPLAEGEQAADLTGLDLSGDILAAAVLAEEPEEVLGRSARRIDLPIRGGALKSIFSALDEVGQAASLEVDWDGAALACTFWVEQDTGLPVRQSVKLTAPIRGEGASIDAMELLVDYTGFGGVSSITVPAEALNAPEESDLGNIM